VRRKQIPLEALIDLQRRLCALPPRGMERRLVVHQAAVGYGVSESTLYCALRTMALPKALRRSDRGVPRVIPKDRMERYCELVAALKIRTANKKGRCLSTVQAIRLLEEYGLDTPDGFTKAPTGLLRTTTINRYLNEWGYDRTTLGREPAVVRFQAEQSNDCRHFDLSPSDLKEVKEPSWVREGKGNPLLMLYSVVDDRSGVAYQEYHGVYGEDVEAALRFLFAAMAPKGSPDFPFQGIPRMLYLDNGPITRSLVFQQVMKYLGIQVRAHLPAGKDGRRTTTRAKGKVERPFRTVKEMHETLYHFHEPHDEIEANQWLFRFLLRYNAMTHRSEPHSRFEDWLLSKCVAPRVKPAEVLTDEAIAVIVGRLVTPLQINHYLSLAVEEAYRIGQKPVTPEVVESVLARDLDGLEARLARQGYQPRVLATLLNIRPMEIKALLHSQMEPVRAQELKNDLHAGRRHCDLASREAVPGT